jgi:hypothetical protein
MKGLYPREDYVEYLKEILAQIEREAFLIPAPNQHTPRIVQLVCEARRGLQSAELALDTAERLSKLTLRKGSDLAQPENEN